MFFCFYFFLQLNNVPFEVEVVEFFRQLEKAGFCIESWTKAPYLCEGDLRQSFYWLTDVVVVVSKSSDKKRIMIG